MTELITPEEAATRLLVKPDTVKGWLRDGKMKGFKAGKFWRIPADELSRFLVAPNALSKAQ